MCPDNLKHPGFRPLIPSLDSLQPHLQSSVQTQNTYRDLQLSCESEENKNKPKTNQKNQLHHLLVNETMGFLFLVKIFNKEMVLRTRLILMTRYNNWGKNINFQSLHWLPA